MAEDERKHATGPARPVGEQLVRTGVRIGPQRALTLILAIGIGLATLLAFAASRVYDAVTESDGVAGFDLPALAVAMGLRSPFLDGVAAVIAEVFGPVGMPILAVAACTALAMRRRSRTPVILTVGAGIGSLLMTTAGKDIIDRHRPPLADAIPPFEYSPSFPSGHTLNATVICGVIAYLLILGRRSRAAQVAIGAAAAVVAIAVGLSRVLLGAHWLTDVLAGWLLGGAWLAAVISAHRLYLLVQQRHAARSRPPASA